MTWVPLISASWDTSQQTKQRSYASLEMSAGNIFAKIKLTLKEVHMIN